MAPRRDGTGFWCALFNLSDEKREIRVEKEALERNWQEAKEIWTGAVLKGGGNIFAELQPHDAAVFTVK